MLFSCAAPSADRPVVNTTTDQVTLAKETTTEPTPAPAPHILKTTVSSFSKKDVAEPSFFNDLEISDDVRKALLSQRRILRKQNAKRVYRLGDHKLTKDDFIDVIDALLNGSFADKPLRAVAISPTAEVRFTGYYSPEVRVSSVKTDEYRYPLMRQPEWDTDTFPTRRQIELEGVLPVDELAIAWAKHPMDVYDLQLQGSGYVRFETGERRYLAYGGTNRYPYQSIELALKRIDSTVTNLSKAGLRAWIDEDPENRDTLTTMNPNYGFFRLSTGRARGAMGVNLTPMLSVAADPKFYPLGSVLMAEIPQNNGSVRKTLLLVQDTGGAIKGSNRLDLYTGTGSAALNVAERTAHTGSVYLMAPGFRSSAG